MSLSSAVSLSLIGSVACITIDNPPVNAISHDVREGLTLAAERIAEDAAIHAAVIICAGKTFVAGADIREFGKPPAPPHLPDVLGAIEVLHKPVVAAIHGTALGGGLELALACHARIMDARASIGLPEVKLGILPGAGGTQRLPRLVGIEKALDMITTGRHVPAEDAKAMGAVDAVVTGDLKTEAIALARSLIGKPIRRTSEQAVPEVAAEAIEAQLKTIHAKARGQLSPVKAAGAVLNARTMPFAEGMAAERQMFETLRASDQSAALRHSFFAEREVAKVAGLEGVAPRPVKTIGIIGAGTMGAGIAMTCLDGGFSVTVVESSEKALETGRGRIDAAYGKMLQQGRISHDQLAERISRIAYALSLEALAACDLIIEAVFEDMTVKQELFAKLDTIVKPGAILATNTSYLDINAIAAVTKRPQDVVGLHFFSPANIMKLLEIIRAEKAAPDVIATALAFARQLKKIPVVCGVCDGFIGNRILATYRKQCELMLEEGALPQDIDAALEAYGFPMGPFAVSDLAGLDIGWARRKRLAPTRNPAERYNPVADQLCELGRFGQKTGKGWYSYDSGKRQVDPEVTALIEANAKAKGLPQRKMSAEDITTRVHAAMVNEGAKILAENIAQRPLDIDVVLMNGYGYPAWRGGPMFEANRIGLPTVLATVNETFARDGAGWEPAALLIEKAHAPEGF